MATKKLIDLDLLTSYDTKIKSYITSQIGSVKGVEVYTNYSLLPTTDVDDKTIAYCEEDYTDIDTSIEYNKGFYEYKDGTGWIIISISSPDYDESKVLTKDIYASTENEGYVKKADEAKMVEALKNAQPNMYLGTDINGNYGAYRLPFSEETKQSGIYQMVLLNPPVNSPQSVESMIDLKDCKVFVQAYKFVAGEQDVISTLKEFNNANKKSFFYDSENVDFNNGMIIKNRYLIQSVPKNELYESEEIKITDYIDNIEIEVI